MTTLTLLRVAPVKKHVRIRVRNQPHYYLLTVGEGLGGAVGGGDDVALVDDGPAAAVAAVPLDGHLPRVLVRTRCLPVHDPHHGVLLAALAALNKLSYIMTPQWS